MERDRRRGLGPVVLTLAIVAGGCASPIVMAEPRVVPVVPEVDAGAPDATQPSVNALFTPPPIEERFLLLTGVIGLADGEPVVSLDWANPTLSRATEWPEEEVPGAVTVAAMGAAGNELTRATLFHGRTTARAGQPIGIGLESATVFVALIEDDERTDRYRIAVGDRTAELAFVRPGPPPGLEASLVDSTLSVTATSVLRGSGGRDVGVVISVHDGTRWVSAFTLSDSFTQGSIDQSIDIVDAVRDLESVAVETWGAELGEPRWVEVTAIGADQSSTSIVLGPILSTDLVD